MHLIVCVCVCLYECVCVCICMDVCVCVFFILMYVHLCVHVCVCACMCVNMCQFCCWCKIFMFVCVTDCDLGSTDCACSDREQQMSGALDIVTGFHVLDGEKHIFVLEGLRDRAIKQLWEALPRPENSGIDHWTLGCLLPCACSCLHLPIKPYCIVLCCIILCCCVVLYCIVLYCIIPPEVRPGDL